MNTSIQKSLLVFFLTLSITNFYAQIEDSVVSITISGIGSSSNEAKLTALRNVIQKAYTTHISSKNEALKDESFTNETENSLNENLKSFEILTEDQIPDGNWEVTIQALVSINKLKKFIETRSGANEINGGLFAIKIKEQLLKEDNEIKTVAEMVNIIHKYIQNSFDYSIINGEPKSLDAGSIMWEIELKATSICNKNIDSCAIYLTNTLNEISLSLEEVQKYKSLNKNVYQLNLNYQNNLKIFYLRKYSSISAINSLIAFWPFLTRNFDVESGIDVTYGQNREKIKGQIFSYTSYTYLEKENYGFTTINIPSSGQIVGTFSWFDEKSLNQIEQMSGYKIKPSLNKINIEEGGYLISENNGHGLVLSLYDLGRGNWYTAKQKCEELIVNGYNDWHLPTIEEFEIIWKNLKSKGIRSGTFPDDDYYWTNSGNYNGDPLYISSQTGRIEQEFGRDTNLFIRAVRTF